MRHEEKYCIVSGISIRGCLLEEASEQERIPSIIGSIVWCCLTSRVSKIKWWFSILFHISCVVIVFRYISIYCDILYSSIWFLTSGIRALSLGKYFLFLQIFFQRRKKRAATFQKISVYFCAKFVETGCRSEFLSEKYPSWKEKNRPKGQDIEVLKSTIFQSFFRGWGHDFLFYFCSS